MSEEQLSPETPSPTAGLDMSKYPEPDANPTEPEDGDYISEVPCEGDEGGVAQSSNQYKDPPPEQESWEEPDKPWNWK